MKNILLVIRASIRKIYALCIIGTQKVWLKIPIPKLSWLSYGIGFGISLIILCFLGYALTKMHQPRETTFLNLDQTSSFSISTAKQFDDIQIRLAKLTDIATNVLNNSQENQNASLQDLLKQLQLALTSLAQQKDMQIIANQIQETKHLTTILSNKFALMETLLNQLHQQLTPPIVDASALPFQVDGIEFWNERAFVRLIDKEHPDFESLMSEGESQGEWRVKQIDIGQHMVVFENNHHQEVKIKI